MPTNKDKLTKLRHAMCDELGMSRTTSLQGILKVAQHTSVLHYTQFCIDFMPSMFDTLQDCIDAGVVEGVGYLEVTETIPVEVINGVKYKVLPDVANNCGYSRCSLYSRLCAKCSSSEREDEQSVYFMELT